MDIRKMRKEYANEILDRKNLKENPFEQFKLWFEEAVEAQVREPNAMALSTCQAHGHPSIRYVLLKQWDEKGFVFFTDYTSRKSQQLGHHPFAAISFFWKEIEKQICIEGPVEKVSEEVSMEYFRVRPRGAQIEAWASHQDSILQDRYQLEESYSSFEKQFEGKEIPLPAYWGGYRIIPHRFEFWQGHANRLHDRFLYTPSGSGWDIARLSP